MQPETLDTVLMVLSWLVIISGSLWFVTGILGYFHRKSYNLTAAESGGSKPITPDFLKVDAKKRQEAIDRGAAYDEVLAKREAAAKAAAGGQAAVEKVGAMARAGALTTASFTLVAAVVGTLTRVKTLQEGAAQLTTWESLVETVQKYPVGAIIAVLVIGANIIVFVKATKTPAKG